MEKQKFQEKSKKRLKTIIAKKFQTATIYPLAQFEKEFGYLWGHGKPDGSLTKAEKQYKDMWEKCRLNILNNGNQQRRNALTELELHKIEWERYNSVFLPLETYNKRMKDGN